MINKYNLLKRFVINDIDDIADMLEGFGYTNEAERLSGNFQKDLDFLFSILEKDKKKFVVINDDGLYEITEVI